MLLVLAPTVVSSPGKRTFRLLRDSFDRFFGKAETEFAGAQQGIEEKITGSGMGALYWVLNHRDPFHTFQTKRARVLRIPTLLGMGALQMQLKSM